MKYVHMNMGLLAALNKAVEMQVAWLECLQELKNFATIVNQAVSKKEIKIIITRKNGERIEALSLAPIMLDTINLNNEHLLEIAVDSPVDDIFKKVKPFIDKIINGSSGLSLGVNYSPGSFQRIPLKEIESIEISKIE